ncbi:hypothetical protein P153DRAFT_295598 [Dothidotthia symphoricarpi CBS 119687]|uniref:MutL C-terminal dimerisation domain-containing protein n=1 Tax=Dothidotthia symphoricarpi CBS 119687 TaxID=1392245 RepID=A0A6A6A636_9PLEO|nr:uncharacterized protein P153DRAFT_295598 [Dothidotthia symphoricarpi CBS 119687]KAF2127442.1 hypothetical protein P153DRAFT_295598 [Dothidotthia symphoricarpi CBS 119687]
MASPSNDTAVDEQRRILPLPPDVVAQIKSSTAIVSLSGVVLELLKNALDARAAKIEATVDFARGGCTVDDDGLGISPRDFSDAGGLGKLYCTSKHDAHEPLLGRNGTFLASLAAMSLLTITSRHVQHRSQNTMTLHHAQVLERQLPASSTHQVHTNHGTRVTVRNLFGNMPVRVKQRSVVLQQKAESDRLWDSLKREVVGLLLAWQGLVNLRVRDENNRLLFNFNTSNTQPPDQTKSRSAHLSSLLNLLTQAEYISIHDWALWVPVSASTSTVSIQGAFSRDPAPSKHTQFISLGIQPLSPDAGHNQLYDEINHLFALSSFGTVEDDADVDELEKIRRRSDKRFKNDDYTNRQLKARKGVDRYPMFHLRITLKDVRKSKLSEERLMNGETNLQAVIGVLSAMVTQWLSVHHLRPRKPRTKQSRFATASSLGESNGGESGVTPGSQTLPPNPVMNRGYTKPSTPDSSSVGGDSRKRKRSALVAMDNPPEKAQRRAFAEWSRIKSGKSDFFNNVSVQHKSVLKDRPQTVTNSEAGLEPVQSFAKFHQEPLLPGSLSAGSALKAPFKTVDTVNDASEETILWTDPSTKKTHALNARTGCVMPQAQSRPNTHSGASMFAAAPQVMPQSLRLTAKPATAETKKTPWLNGLLRSWDNPVFKPSERRIQQVSLQEPEHNQGHSHCSRIDVEKAFNEASATGSSRLSREGLQGAEVLTQLDKKFIFIKMRSSTDATADLLVLIDQHAADERIQVECLLKELCTPSAKDYPQSGYQSKLGHTSRVAFTSLDKPVQFTISSQERTHFTTHAARFAAWGILFDILGTTRPTETLETSTKSQYVLSVTTLPPGIAQRCRADAQVLVSFLRSTVWTYAETLHLPALVPFSTDDDPSTWVRRLATCPQGLVDLVNSRACRSAIMFNDELSLGQCEDLVQKLARCVFPFMCAHGRPSMVPLVDLGRVGWGGHAVDGEQASNNDGFVRAWKRWKG